MADFEEEKPVKASPEAKPKSPDTDALGIGAGVRAVTSAALTPPGVNMDEDVTAFPPEMHDMILALRRMKHDDYLVLVDLCRGTEVRTVENDFSPELNAFLAYVDAMGNFEDFARDILLLTRTERPEDGRNVLEKANMTKRSYDPAHTLMVTCRMNNSMNYTFTVAPQDDDHSIVTSHTGAMYKVASGQTIGLGSGSVYVKEAFGRALNEKRKAKCHVRIGDKPDAKGNTSMSRTCIRVSRDTAGQVRILECGARNVEKVQVEEKDPAGVVISRIGFDVKGGETEMFALDNG